MLKFLILVLTFFAIIIPVASFAEPFSDSMLSVVRADLNRHQPTDFECVHPNGCSLDKKTYKVIGMSQDEGNPKPSLSLLVAGKNIGYGNSLCAKKIILSTDNVDTISISFDALKSSKFVNPEIRINGESKIFSIPYREWTNNSHEFSFKQTKSVVLELCAYSTYKAGDYLFVYFDNYKWNTHLVETSILQTTPITPEITQDNTLKIPKSQTPDIPINSKSVEFESLDDSLFESFVKYSILSVGIIALIVMVKGTWGKKQKIDKEFTNFFDENFSKNEYDSNDELHEEEKHDQRNQEQNSQDYLDSKPTTIQDAYEILEVNEQSTSDEIKQSRNRLSLQWHPDKHRTPARKQIAEKEMKLINESFEILKRELKFV